MADTARILETVLHYLVMLLAIFLVLLGVRSAVGEVGFWVELLIVIVVAALYPPLVRRLGVAPRSWERN